MRYQRIPGVGPLKSYMMKKLELEIVALSHSVTQSHNYAVVLGEVGGNRRLPIVIGGFEAQAIAVAMERMTPNRPLTHDLFKNTLDTFDIDLKEVIINKKNGIDSIECKFCSKNFSDDEMRRKSRYIPFDADISPSAG